jgi:acetyl esterase
MSNTDYFTSDPDWEIFATENGFSLPSKNTPPPLNKIPPIEIDVTAARAGQSIGDSEWSDAHSLESVGYAARLGTVKSRDEADISIRIAFPSSSRLQGKAKTALPVLFVTHGGGWVQGSHLSEEAWLLWPLYEHLDLITVSVEYRLAPEHKHPVWIEDSWDVLEKLFSQKEPFFLSLDVELDFKRVILAGSSSGAAISATISHMSRDKGLPIAGVLLNVPVLCDYRHFPKDFANESQPSSYRECADTFLSSGYMISAWNGIHPSLTSGSDPLASPLLGNVGKLPPHLIFVAGQDSLRDEGIAYAKKLEKVGVPVELHVYNGVPHNFAHYEELTATRRFWEDLRAGLGKLSASK